MTPLAEKYAKAGFTKEEADVLEVAVLTLSERLAPLAGNPGVRLYRPYQVSVQHLEAIREVRAVAGFEE